MKKVLFVFGVLLIVLSIFVTRILITSGFFRKVETHYNGSITEIPLPGVEDMAISRADSFLILSSDDRAASRNNRQRKTGLYLLDLKKPESEPKLLTRQFEDLFFPHGISMLKIDSATYRIWAISHPRNEHVIEVFDLVGSELTHVKTIEDALIVSPNDIVATGPRTFYFTNDHKYTPGFNRMLEDYMGMALSNVVYYENDNFSEVANGIAYANGINVDSTRNLVFVASPRDFIVKVFQKMDSGELNFIEDIDVETGVDNIEIGPDGKLWIGCHPNLMAFARYAMGKIDKSPSEIITIDYREKGDYEIKSIFTDDGEIISASTVAIPFGNQVYVGNVMDDHILVWERKEP